MRKFQCAFWVEDHRGSQAFLSLDQQLQRLLVICWRCKFSGLLNQKGWWSRGQAVVHFRRPCRWFWRTLRCRTRELEKCRLVLGPDIGKSPRHPLGPHQTSILFFATPLVSSKLTQLINFFFFFVFSSIHCMFRALKRPNSFKPSSTGSCGNQSHHRNYIGYLKVYAIDPGTFEELRVLNQSIATDNRLLVCVLQEIWGVMGFIWEIPKEQPWEVSWRKANLNRVLTCE